MLRSIFKMYFCSSSRMSKKKTKSFKKRIALTYCNDTVACAKTTGKPENTQIFASTFYSFDIHLSYKIYRSSL